MITPGQLALIYPAHAGRAPLFAPIFDRLLPEAGIDTTRRLAAFLGQVGHESGQLRWVRELADGRAYEGRTDLGNTVAGDGPRFKGRGLIQLTGRANYTRFAQETGIDCLASPAVLEEPENAVRVAVWFWTNRNLNDFADRWDYVGVTRRINGGTNGLEERVTLWCNALRVLGAS